MLVSLSSNWCTEPNCVRIIDWNRITSIPADVAVGSVCSYCKEERLLAICRVVEESVCLFGQNIGRVFAGVAFWWFFVLLETAVQVLIGEWIDQKVLYLYELKSDATRHSRNYRLSEAIGIRLVIIVNGMSIEQFTNVVGIVSSCLEPHG